MRRKVIILLAVLLALGLVFVALWHAGAGRDSEKDLPNPLVQGIPLSAWMQKALVQDDYWEYVRALKPVAAQAAPYLSRALRHKDNFLNSAYVKIWPKLPGAFQRHLSQPILARDVRIRAVVLLREIGNPAKAAIPDLIERLSDKDGTIRLHSAIALGNMGPDAKSALPFLEAFLHSESHTVRVYTAAAVWKITQQTEPSLSILEAGLEQTNAAFRWAAATFLGEMGPAARPAIPLLAEAVHASDKEVASLSVQALADIGAESLPILTNVLADPDPAMRISAAVALGKLGPKAREAAPLLTNLLKDNATGSPTIMGRAVGNPERVGDAAAKALSQVNSTH
jgi:HEAT repeat protein